MFFYLHCGRGFNCSHRRWMKRCLISYFLCGNPQSNFGPQKAWKNLGLGVCEMEDRREGGRGFILWLLWHVIFILVAVWIHYIFLYFISRQHTSTFRTRNIATFHFQQNFSTANASDSKISNEKVELLQAAWWYNVPFPRLRTITQLPVSNT